jgi:hypothetical protein
VSGEVCGVSGAELRLRMNAVMSYSSSYWACSHSSGAGAEAEAAAGAAPGNSSSNCSVPIVSMAAFSLLITVFAVSILNFCNLQSKIGFLVTTLDE